MSFQYKTDEIVIIINILWFCALIVIIQWLFELVFTYKFYYKMWFQTPFPFDPTTASAEISAYKRKEMLKTNQFSTRKLTPRFYLTSEERWKWKVNASLISQIRNRTFIVTFQLFSMKCEFFWNHKTLLRNPVLAI